MTMCRTLLAAAVATASVAMPLAQAQQAPMSNAQVDAQQATDASVTPPTQAATELDAVVVTGIRASLRNSLDTKRNADAIVDAITAEDIGKFPDKNVAESLSHIPGITLDRNFGEGEQVSIRGTEPSLNRTLLNGQSIASTDWQILEGPGRSFNYTLLSPDIVGRLEVFKSPEARIDEGSIGGTVIVYTRRPLDLPANTFNGSLGYAYNDRAGEGDPSVSALYSWKNADDNFGVVLSALHSRENLRRDAVEVFSYPTVASTTAVGGFPTLTGTDRDVRFPNAINAALFEQERKRDSVTLGLQAKPTDGFELNLTGLYIKGKYDNYNQSRYAFNNCSAPGLACAAQATDASVRDGVVNSATFGNGLTLLDAINRHAEVKTTAIDLRGDWKGDGWKASAQIGDTRSDGGTRRQDFLEFEGLGGYSYALGRESARIDFANDPANAASMQRIGLAELRQQPTRDRERYAQGDVGINVDWGPVSQLQFGVKHRNHKTGQTDRIAIVGGTGGLSLADFAGSLTPGDYMDGIDADGGLRGWRTVDRGALLGYLGGVPENGALVERPEGSFNVKEKIDSAYVQADLSFGPVRGNAGVRFVRTNQVSMGQTRTPLGLIPNEFHKSYQDWLPSLNLVWDLTDDVKLRMAASRNIARADFSDLSSFIVLRDTVLTGSGGNPDLDPYHADNYDLSAEWYFSPTGLLSATAFYKELDSFIVNRSELEQQLNVTTGRFETYEITRPRNGSGGRLYGMELAFQNTWDSGFGVQANYTWSDGGTSDGMEVPFNSRNTVTLTPFYENDRFTARLTYSWRDKYLRAIGLGGVATTNASYTQLDASIGYRVNDHLEFTLEGLNLLDETQRRYAGVESRPLGFMRNGRRYFVNARFRF